MQARTGRQRGVRKAGTKSVKTAPASWEQSSSFFAGGQDGVAFF